MKNGITARVGRFFLGCDTLYICDDDALNLLGALHYSAVRRQDGWELSMSSADRAQAQLLLSESGSDYSVLRRSGLPALCSRFSHRPGIPTGAVLACLLAAMLSRFIWTLDVAPRDGQERDAELEQSLLDGVRALGCTEGAFIPTLDLFEVCSAYLAENSLVSWMSIDIEGTAAQLRYTKTAYRDGKIDDSMPSNVIATREGVVEYVNTGAGEAAVGDGDNIAAGQLLISGALENKNTGVVRYTHARGSVIAHTQHVLTAEAPLAISVREYGSIARDIKFSLFGHSLHLLRHTPHTDASYELEHSSGRLTLPGGIVLPITIDTDSYCYYTIHSRERSLEEAARAAEAQITAMLHREIGESEVLSRADEGFLESRAEGDVYILRTTVHCLEDVAEVVPLPVMDDGR